VFLGTIGGLLAYGLIGVFLGPTLVAIAYTLLLAWLAESETGQPLCSQNKVPVANSPNLLFSSQCAKS
jgi:predicted PurR-regulated permease PerM